MRPEVSSRQRAEPDKQYLPIKQKLHMPYYPRTYCKHRVGVDPASGRKVARSLDRSSAAERTTRPIEDDARGEEQKGLQPPSKAEDPGTAPAEEPGFGNGSHSTSAGDHSPRIRPRLAAQAASKDLNSGRSKAVTKTLRPPAPP